VSRPESAAELVAGRYQLQNVLGEGGMGVVWRALDCRIQRHVALKRIFRRDEAASLFLAREIHALSRLAHPNLVSVLDTGIGDDGAPFLVMELVPGASLKQELARRGRLPVERASEIAVQIARALAAAHAEGVVHRDLKPSNIMLTQLYGEIDHVKLVDFGIAHVAGASQASLTGSSFFSTPQYASPEQATGAPSSTSCDLYALGVVLFEMLTGRLPFAAETALGLLYHHAHTPPPRPVVFFPELPTWLDELVVCLLQKRASHRPGSAREVLECLRSQRAPIGDVALEATEALGVSLSLAAPASFVDPTLGESARDDFVGRELELRGLGGRLAQAMNGRGGVVLISGEAGLGKTTLAERFFELARASVRPFAACGRCFEHATSGEPYFPFLEAVATLLKGSDGAHCKELLRRHAPTWCLQFPGHFSDSDASGLRRETSGSDRERMLRELGDLLSALADERGVLLLLEDLHWADPSSVDLLRLLCSRSGGQRWLLVGTFRGELLPLSNPPLERLRRDVNALRDCAELPLSGLTEAQLREYVGMRFWSHALPDDFLKTLARRTEGQPLFLTRLLDLLVERGDLHEVDGTWRLARPTSAVSLDVPAAVSAVIERKLASLPEADRRALQYASVEGAEFRSDVLAALLEEDEVELEEKLGGLERIHHLVERVREEKVAAGRFVTHYRFAHALYHESLYGALAGARRRDLHRRAAAALQGHETQPALLALHFERAGDVLSATRYLLAAGEKAEATYATPEAMQVYTRALGMLGELPLEQRPPHYASLQRKLGKLALSIRDDALTTAAYAALLSHGQATSDVEAQLEGCIGLAAGAYHRHDLGDMEQWLERGLTLATSGAHERYESVLLALAGDRELRLNQFEAAARLLDRALTLGQAHRYLPALENALPSRAALHFERAEYAAAAALNERALALGLSAFTVVRRKHSLGEALVCLGRISDGLGLLEESIELSRLRAPSRIRRQIGPMAIGSVHRELGDLERSFELHQSALACLQALVEADRVESLDLRQKLAGCHLELARDYIAAERTAEAVASLQHAERGLRDIAQRTDRPLPWRLERDCSLVRLELELREGSGGGSRAAALELLARCRHDGCRSHELETLTLLARIERASGHLDLAIQELSFGVRMLREHPMPLLAWRAYALLAELYEASGDCAAARAALAESASVIDAIATNIRDPRLRDIFLSRQEVRSVLAGAAAASQA
jgi:tetratricopeptide (TPR) repeat protein